MRTDIPKIIGHRGAAGRAPENTLAGFRKAHELGCQWVEFDCMLSQDDVVILHHDDSVDRTTNGTGIVSDLPFAALRRLDAGSFFSLSFANASIPSFDETVTLLSDLSMGANVEIKPVTGHDRRTGQHVSQAILDLWPAHLSPPVVSSFSLEALEASLATAPGLDRAILWWEIPEDWHAHHRRLGASAVHVNAKKLSMVQAASFRDNGVPFRCYTVNDPAEAERLFEWGCEAVFTDYPDRFL